MGIIGPDSKSQVQNQSPSALGQAEMSVMCAERGANGKKSESSRATLASEWVNQPKNSGKLLLMLE